MLAGGRSLRFGTEKAVAVHRGDVLIAVAAAALSAHCPDLAVNAPPGSGAAAFATNVGLSLVTDRPGAPDGPLAGLREGLAWAASIGAEMLAVLPCDLPHVTPEVPAALIAALTANGNAGAIAAHDHKGPHALCSVWRVTGLPVVEAALAGGAHPPVRRVLEALGGLWLPIEAKFLINANTPDDLRP